MASVVSLAILASFWLWGRLDRQIASTAHASYQPVPLSNNPSYKPNKDVSIITCALDPPSAFTASLRSCLDNDPLELIIVTTEKHLGDFHKRLEMASLTADQAAKVSVLAIDPSKSGKREQMKIGIEAATGHIIATVDDHILY
ncbi:uncharacterized protein BCR38DRAFT_412751 [Pseudomassariella vexata]|uniref:Nucleotide-diphospho-sugar transferase n=1 Tax=Pseudomassariella vexata TaxID=1141098 RepID=A0A1Y2DKG2_9PEZI|nr:uncharacterized protein BCR38DRAFT_412751 [Pseudomassariella vexata]ORY59757.1 hypothetical protein BCR38DRAFT_412751 [Pseudomassariella vexata]